MVWYVILETSMLIPPQPFSKTLFATVPLNGFLNNVACKEVFCKITLIESRSSQPSSSNLIEVDIKLLTARITIMCAPSVYSLMAKGDSFSS